MSDYLLHCAASNWCVSSVLAAFAWIAQVKLKRPMIAHLLWLLVLVKLVTPPLVSLPILPAPEQPTPMVMAPVDTSVVPMAIDAQPVAAPIDWTAVLLGAWAIGSIIVLLWSSIRILRFHRLLTMASQPAPRDLRERATKLGRQLGLTKMPSLHMTSARVSPMVWWLGGQVRIFVPADMPKELGTAKMRWILAHELAHVRRGDHYVRWLEWLACVAFWWNPVAWLARRNLRANEEVCCDALVLRSFEGKPHSYANSLLSAVEFLASPGLRPPAMASEINSGGFLERRFRMIVSKTPIATTPRWLQAVLLAGTAAILPLGVAYAQNPDVPAVTKRLKKSVDAGELTPKQARTMLRALKEQAAKDTQKKRRAAEANRERAHYDRLVESLKEGLREGLRSGKIEEQEAAELYQRQLERLKRGMAEREEKRAKEREIAYLEKVHLDSLLKKRDMEAREQARRAAEISTARRAKNNEKYTELLREYERRVKAGKARERDLTKDRARLDQRLSDIEATKRDIEERAKQLERLQADLEEKQAVMKAEAKDRAMQLRNLERSLVDKQKQLEAAEYQLRKVDFSKKKKDSKIPDGFRNVRKQRQLDLDLPKKKREWNIQLDLDKKAAEQALRLKWRRDQEAKAAEEATRAANEAARLQWRRDRLDQAYEKASVEAVKKALDKAAAKSQKTSDKLDLRWDTRRLNPKKKTEVRWDTRVDKSKKVDTSRKIDLTKRAKVKWANEWNSDLRLQKALDEKAMSLEALKKAKEAAKKAHDAEKAAQNVRVRFQLHDREAAAAAEKAAAKQAAADFRALQDVRKQAAAEAAEAARVSFELIKMHDVERDRRKQAEVDAKRLKEKAEWVRVTAELEEAAARAAAETAAKDKAAQKKADKKKADKKSRRTRRSGIR